MLINKLSGVDFYNDMWDEQGFLSWMIQMLITTLYQNKWDIYREKEIYFKKLAHMIAEVWGVWNPMG